MNESKSEYLLLFRNNEWYKKLSPDETLCAQFHLITPSNYPPADPITPKHR